VFSIIARSPEETIKKTKFFQTEFSDAELSQTSQNQPVNNQPLSYDVAISHIGAFDDA
jgi:hypothetical protein